METLSLAPGQAAALGVHAERIEGAAHELALFGEREPVLCGECGCDVPSLEARTILSGGAPNRIAEAARHSALSGTPMAVTRSDLDALSRLEGVVMLGSSRIGFKMASLDAEDKQSGVTQLGGLIGLATGVAGLVKTIL